MTNAEQILGVLDARLSSPVELTLYGRAALLLGFANPPVEYGLSHDVDAVLWLGQAEELAQRTNFWEAVEHTNEQLARAPRLDSRCVATATTVEEALRQARVPDIPELREQFTKASRRLLEKL
jgi:hypothetical protein